MEGLQKRVTSRESGRIKTLGGEKEKNTDPGSGNDTCKGPEARDNKILSLAAVC